MVGLAPTPTHVNLGKLVPLQQKFGSGWARNAQRPPNITFDPKYSLRSSISGVGKLIPDKSTKRKNGLAPDKEIRREYIPMQVFTVHVNS
jgi:hypothetical protein